MKKIKQWVIVFISICSSALAQEDTNLYYRVIACGSPLSRCSSTSKEVNRDVKDYLAERCHVNWPNGSMAILADDRSNFIVRNTRENLDKISNIIWAHLWGPQVAIECSIIAFRQDDIESLQKKDGVTPETLHGLRQRGRSKLITTASTRTKAGNEVVFKDVQEVIYQTQLITKSITNSAGDISVALIPCNDTMREVGTILQVYPDVAGSDKLINLTIHFQWITLSRWENYGSALSTKGKEGKTVSLKTPIFDVSSAESTTITVRTGETILLGSGKNVGSDWVYFHLLKAEIIPAEANNTNGKPSASAVGIND